MPMRRRRERQQPPPPPPPPAPSFGATARPTSPRSSISAAAAVATDLDELLLTVPSPAASEARSFPYTVKQQCWEKAEARSGCPAATRRGGAMTDGNGGAEGQLAGEGEEDGERRETVAVLGLRCSL